MNRSACFFLLFLVAMLLASCHLTGDFTIAKRKYMKGWQISMPSRCGNTDMRRICVAKRNAAAEIKTMTKDKSCENILISNVAKAPAMEMMAEKNILTSVNIDLPPDTGKTVKPDTIKKNTGNGNKNGQGENIRRDNRRIFTPALIAFLLNFDVFFFSIGLFPNYTASSPVFLLVMLPLIGLIIGTVSQVKIANHRDIYKGLGFAVAAVILGVLYYVLLVLAIFILARQH